VERFKALPDVLQNISAFIYCPQVKSGLG